VWLALELKRVAYESVLTSTSTRGLSACVPPVSVGEGQVTPCLTVQGRQPVDGGGLSILRLMDTLFPETPRLWPPPAVTPAEVTTMVQAMERTLPGDARPCDRARFLYVSNRNVLPDPLPRHVFESVCDRIDLLLAKHDGPFFCGTQLSAADVAWAPYLERYAVMLPLLHEGLQLRRGRWAHLEHWYAAMDSVPVYACRIKGSEASWRKVLARPPWWPTGWATGMGKAQGTSERALCRWEIRRAHRFGQHGPMGRVRA